MSGQVIPIRRSPPGKMHRAAVACACELSHPIGMAECNAILFLQLCNSRPANCWRAATVHSLTLRENFRHHFNQNFIKIQKFNKKPGRIPDGSIEPSRAVKQFLQNLKKISKKLISRPRVGARAATQETL